MANPDHSTDCPSCGESLSNRDEGSTLIVECGACGWNVATTNYNLPLWDATPYDVYVCVPDGALNQAAATLAAVVGRPAIKVRGCLADNQPMLQGAKAPDVIRLANTVRDLGIQLRTEPLFPWSLEPGEKSDKL